MLRNEKYCKLVYLISDRYRASVDEAAAVMADLLELEYHFDSWVEGACGDAGTSDHDFLLICAFTLYSCTGPITASHFNTKV